MFKQAICSCAAAFLVLWACVPVSAAAEPPTVSASAAIVMEAETGRVLFAKNAEEKLSLIHISEPTRP